VELDFQAGLRGDDIPDKAAIIQACRWIRRGDGTDGASVNLRRQGIRLSLYRRQIVQADPVELVELKMLITEADKHSGLADGVGALAENWAKTIVG